MEGVRRNGAIPSAGLTVLFDPKEPSLDIVFIHGFTGHPERTWSHKKGNKDQRNEDNSEGGTAEPPHKARKLNLFSRPHQEGEGNGISAGVYWPRDLVPVTIPCARVLTYGYDTHLRHRLGQPISKNTVYDIAWDFLVALEAERLVEPSRPVLFIAHSLGGILVKETLRRSMGCKLSQTHLRSIFDSTIGIMFFGTPHGGADPRGFLQNIAVAVVKAAGLQVNEQIVKALLPSSERLKELRDEFGPIAHHQDWMIHSFQEEFGINALSGRKVVEDVSSYLNLPSVEITQHIGQNHMDMCRFTGLSDVDYKKVTAALHRLTRGVSRKSKRGEIPGLNENQRQMLVDSMRFDHIDARHMTIKSAHAKTCQWLLKTPEYLDWLDATKLHKHCGFLWIKGKPGTGKSTIMKFAVSRSFGIMEDGIIISFFFNGRGSELEKSTIGMYRSLLLQLFDRLPELQCVFDYVGLATWKFHVNGTRSQWTVEVLKDLFGQAIRRLGNFSVVCFIDAMDECEERQIRDMLSLFEELGDLTVSSGIRFRVCFSSRHYPHITIRNGLNLVLEAKEGHNQDITSYINSELKIGHSKRAERIKDELQRKSSGVFMWVVLVVDIMNKDYDRGRLHALEERLQDIPSDLFQLFRDILTRDLHNRDELLLCIQWLLFTRQLLKPEELYFAIRSGTDPQGLSRWDPDEIPTDAVRKFILNASKGLAEITKAKNPTVQFIHESVRDFLLRENGLRKVWSDLSGNFQAQSHEQLKDCCLNYMSINIASHVNINTLYVQWEETKALNQSATEAFPFMQYAVQNILYHANAAEAGGITQKDFIKGFPLANWIGMDNLFRMHDERLLSPNASLLYILAEQNMSNLIRIHPAKLSCFEVEDERYGPPYFAALANGGEETIQEFWKIQAEAQSPTSLLHDLCKEYREDSKAMKLWGDFHFSRQRTIESYVAERDDQTLLKLLLQIGEFLLERKDGNSRTALSWAAGAGCEEIVKLLLHIGADIKSKDKEGRTPLHWADQNGYSRVVSLLLDEEAKY